jgi:hypothetical protein
VNASPPLVARRGVAREHRGDGETSLRHWNAQPSEAGTMPR